MLNSGPILVAPLLPPVLCFHDDPKDPKDPKDSKDPKA